MLMPAGRPPYQQPPMHFIMLIVCVRWATAHATQTVACEVSNYRAHAAHVRPLSLRPQRHRLDPLRARPARVQQLDPLPLAGEGHDRGRAAAPAHAPGALRSWPRQPICLQVSFVVCKVS